MRVEPRRWLLVAELLLAWDDVRQMPVVLSEDDWRGWKHSIPSIFD